MSKCKMLVAKMSIVVFNQPHAQSCTALQKNAIRPMVIPTIYIYPWKKQLPEAHTQYSLILCSFRFAFIAKSYFHSQENYTHKFQLNHLLKCMAKLWSNFLILTQAFFNKSQYEYNKKNACVLITLTVRKISNLQMIDVIVFAYSLGVQVFALSLCYFKGLQ